MKSTAGGGGAAAILRAPASFMRALIIDGHG
jgi:hypothetical protein